jgi:methionine synthase II (cobalamin-independent)
MTAAEKLYQLIQSLPENQINEVLNFAEFLYQKQLTTPPAKAISPGTLTGLRGIAKRPGPAPSDRELQEEYTDYLTQKYQ